MIAAQSNAWHDLLWPMVNLSFHLTVYFPGVCWILLVGGPIISRLQRDRPNAPIPPESAQPLSQRPLSDPQVRLPGFLLWAPSLGCLLAIVVHTFVRWFVRPWYFVPLAATVALAAALAGTPFLLRCGRRMQAAILLAAIMIMGLHGLRVFREQSYPGQADLYAAAQWLRGQSVPGTAVGAFNAGILGTSRAMPSSTSTEWLTGARSMPVNSSGW